MGGVVDRSCPALVSSETRASRRRPEKPQQRTRNGSLPEEPDRGSTLSVLRSLAEDLGGKHVDWRRVVERTRNSGVGRVVSDEAGIEVVGGHASCFSSQRWLSG